MKMNWFMWVCVVGGGLHAFAAVASADNEDRRFNGSMALLFTIAFKVESACLLALEVLKPGD